jgi:nicotinamidase-related amidase
MKIALYETDIQNDFTYRDGALFVSALEEVIEEPYGAETAVPNILALHKHAKENDWQILGSVHRHFDDDLELAKNGGPFPDHCMDGTYGQERIEGLESTFDHYIPHKNPSENTNDSGSQLIFEKQHYDVSTNSRFAPVINNLIKTGLDAVVIDGFATDYCVRAAALAFVEVATLQGKQVGEDFHVYVVTDAIKEVNINDKGEVDKQYGQKALEELYSAGVKGITTAEILEGKIGEIK